MNIAVIYLPSIIRNQQESDVSREQRLSSQIAHTTLTRTMRHAAYILINLIKHNE